jgi:hypothetical protein
MSAGVTVSDDDAVELAEMLEFLHDWTGLLPGALTESLARFVGGDGYVIEDLRADLARFAFLLGGDGERLFRTQP